MVECYGVSFWLYLQKELGGTINRLALGCDNRCICVIMQFYRNWNGFQSQNLRTVQECDREARFKKTSFTFGRGLRPKSCEQDLVAEINVKVTAKRLDYYVGITKSERSFGSNRVKFEREQLWCNQNIKFSDCDRVVRVIATGIFQLRLTEITRIDLLILTEDNLFLTQSDLWIKHINVCCYNKATQS